MRRTLVPAEDLNFPSPDVPSALLALTPEGTEEHQAGFSHQTKKKKRGK